MGEPHTAPAGREGDGRGQGRERLRLTRREWVLLLVLAAVQFTHLVDFVIVLPLAPKFKAQWELTSQQFGYMVAAYAISAGVCSLLAAWFIDRFDRRTALVVLYTGFTAGTLFCAAAPDYPLLVVARAVAGGFGGVAAACVLTIVGDVFADERRGTATGVVMSAFSVASIVGVPAGLWLANASGWRAPFGVLGVLSLGVLALVRGVLPPLRGHLGRHHGDPLQNLKVVISRPTHLRAYALMIALVMSTFLVVPYLADFLTANVGVTATQLPYVYLSGGLATLLTLTPIGRLSDLWGKLRVFRVLGLLTAVPLLLLTNLPPVVPLAGVLVCTTLMMVITSGRMVPAMALITASAAPRYRGSFLSVNSSVQQLACGLAALAAGALLHQQGDGKLTGYPTVGLLAACATVLSVLLAGRLRPAEGGREAIDLLVDHCG
jgi:predicted MFS family arabinose efflux permease